MNKMVAGFAFNHDLSEVAMIRKIKPKWQANKLNGIGGKVEDFDTNDWWAMVREFEEETSVITYTDQWEEICRIYADDRGDDSFTVQFYYTILTSEQWDGLTTTTAEEVVKIKVDDLSNHDRIDNIDMLVAYSLYKYQHTENLKVDFI